MKACEEGKGQKDGYRRGRSRRRKGQRRAKWPETERGIVREIVCWKREGTGHGEGKKVRKLEFVSSDCRKAQALQFSSKVDDKQHTCFPCLFQGSLDIFVRLPFASSRN
jgi:hypothetical protein